MNNRLTLKEASKWASEYLNRNISSSNISYLIQYGRIKKINNNGSILIDKEELKKYYKAYSGKREIDWKEKLGEDLNWVLSFDHLREVDTTKHVHRLHPYKGKFIPQLVEYFLDDHTDNFKRDVYFKKGDIILDPFCGSGTTLVQATELGMHAIGVDISAFNSLISNVKVGDFNIADIYRETKEISRSLKEFLVNHKTLEFEYKLLEELGEFNNRFFPSPDFKYKIRNHKINEKEYTTKYERLFLEKYYNLISEYSIVLKQDNSNNFLDKWYLKPVRDEVDFVFEKVKKIKNIQTKKVVSIILSRTIRSCRATTHADLATLIEPIAETYYCKKHGKICKPLFSIINWWERYSKDTIKRLTEFKKLKTPTLQYCLTGDSKNINIFDELQNKLPKLAELTRIKKIKGIFSSPPYVGLIDYHDQHAYAYDLFGFGRNDNLEIGPLSKGQGREARESYVNGISEVLKNSKKFFAEDFDIFLVANDKYNLYPTIAKNAGLKIINTYKRPVLNRTEKDKSAYSEFIFHLKQE